MPPRNPKKPAPVIVKRSADERKKLPPELEAFARSQDEKLRLPRKREDKGRLRDPREGYTIAGVSNRDARAVYDARAEAMRALWAEGAADPAALAELGGLLHDLVRLTLWRARRVTGFDAFVEQVVGLPADRARQLAAAFGQESGESDAPLSERDVAIWLRTEAGLFEGDGGARARIETVGGDEPRLTLALRLSGASAGLAGVGARHAPLAREQAEAAGVPARFEGPAKARGEGGAKLLTRKRADESEFAQAPELTPRGSDGEHEQERSPGDEREGDFDSTPPAPTRARAGGDRPLKRKAFGSGEGGRSFAARGDFEQAGGFAQRRNFGDQGGFERPRFNQQKASVGERRAGSEGPAFGAKRGFGDKRAFGDKRGFGKERAFDGERGSERPPAREQRGFGAKRAFGDKRGFGKERAFDGERSGERPPFREKRGFGDKRGFGKGAGAKVGETRRREGGFQEARGEKRPFKKGGFAGKAGGGFAGKAGGGFAAKRGREFGESAARGAQRGGFDKRFAGKSKGPKGKAQGRTGAQRERRTDKRRDDAVDE